MCSHLYKIVYFHVYFIHGAMSENMFKQWSSLVSGFGDFFPS